MTRPPRICRLATAASCLAVAGTVATGCGGNTKTVTRPYTAAQIERQIQRSIEPTLAANLGEGSTMTVACVEDEEFAYRCTTVLKPGGETAGAVRVIYRVDCDASACRWTPIG